MKRLYVRVVLWLIEPALKEKGKRERAEADARFEAAFPAMVESMRKSLEQRAAMSGSCEAPPTSSSALADGVLVAQNAANSPSKKTDDPGVRAGDEAMASKAADRFLESVGSTLSKMVANGPVRSERRAL